MLLKILIFLFLLLKFGKSYEQLSISDEHVPLIIDICKLYRTNSVIFLYGESIKEIEITTVMFKWTRALSREGFMTTNFYFSALHKSSYYEKKIVLPLYVAMITDHNAIDEFSSATSKFDMSFAVWLVVFIYTGHDPDYCHNPPFNIFHLRFDSEMLVICGKENLISEWYSLDGNQTEINDLARWNSNDKTVLINSKSLYERRNNLQGLVMNAVVVKDSPFLKIDDVQLDGIFGRVLTELCATLNFSFNVVSEVEEYGVWNQRKNTWSGAIGEIYYGRADISFSDFAMSCSRMNVVDFSFPLFVTRNSLFFRDPHIFTIKWSTYFSTFTYTVWIIIFLVLMAASILLIFLKIKIGSNHNLMHLGSDSFLEVWGIVCQQSLKDFPQRTSLKVAYFSIFLLGTVLSAAYSASLISFLTSAVHKLPFTSLDAFIEDGTYKLVVRRGSGEYDAIVNSDKPLINKLSKLMMEEDKLPLSFLDTINLLCKNPKLAAYISIEGEYEINSSVLCEVVSVNIGGIENISIILSKHNAFTSVINFHLQKFINNGMLNRFKDSAFKRKFQQTIQKHIPVSINCVISLFFFILIGVVFSICILFIEKYVFFRIIKKKSVINLIPSI